MNLFYFADVCCLISLELKEAKVAGLWARVPSNIIVANLVDTEFIP